MSKSEQTGGGGTETTPRKEPKPKQKRPWIKPRLAFIEINFSTRTGQNAFSYSPFEADAPDADRVRYRVPTS